MKIEEVIDYAGKFCYDEKLIEMLESVQQTQNELIKIVIEDIKSYCFVSDKKIKNAECINYNKSLCDKNCRIPFIEKIKGKKWEEILKDGK
jgi:hypothetical protein